MIKIAVPSVSDHLSLDEAITKLKLSPLVDGIAEFGSRATNQAHGSSDYDLLLLVKAIPTQVFQMVTTIDGRLTDIVLVEIETADKLINTPEPLDPKSFEGLFLLKMQTARILYDASKRLQKIQRLVTDENWRFQRTVNQHDTDMYIIWFWQSFGLIQLERKAQGQDPIHRSAFDMMLTSCLTGTWRSYFDIRQIPWEGETSAIHYWTKHDKAYLQSVRKCLETNNRTDKLAAYRDLVEQTIKPIGKVLAKGETAAILTNSNSSVNVQRVLKYWQSLFS